MQPYQQRVIDEKAELDAKLEKLRVFIGGGFFAELMDDQKRRLYRQFHAMGDYSDALNDRILAFNEQ